MGKDAPDIKELLRTIQDLLSQAQEGSGNTVQDKARLQELLSETLSLAQQHLTPAQQQGLAGIVGSLLARKSGKQK